MTDSVPRPHIPPGVVRLTLSYVDGRTGLDAVLGQRAALLRQALEADPSWAAWWRAPGHPARWLHIMWELTDRAQTAPPVQIDETPAPPGGSARVDVTVRDSRRGYPKDDTAATVRFVAAVDELMGALAARYGVPTPTPLPRTRRERQWVAEGNQEPAHHWPANLDRRAEVLAMAPERFWALLDHLEGSMAERAEQLAQALSALKADDVAAFNETWVQTAGGLAEPGVRAAAEQLLGHVSDDVFEDLCGFVVAHGQAATAAVTTDPSHLAALVHDDEEIGAAAELAGCAAKVYAARTGRALEDDYRRMSRHQEVREGHALSAGPTKT